MDGYKSVFNLIIEIFVLKWQYQSYHFDIASFSLRGV